MAELLDILTKYDADRKKQREGVWDEIELVPADEEAGTEAVTLEVKIASSGNRAYQARLVELMAPYRDTLKEGVPISDEESDLIFAKAMAGTILVDWKLQHHGQPVPFDEEHAASLLIEIPDLREEIANRARQREKYRLENVEAVAERLGETFGGASKTETSSGAKSGKRSKSGSKKG